ncbi:alcohol dehydrogenase [Aureimonas endophytica]|uniref:Alcohol dehydrogenase n=1 Tax=Aureimonas endophytica TaxID=2027858 RepID=A0A917E8R4_9HYPH|nr:MDR family oxidoreductase [Aureimonas endophytica]GGE15836.1 alcohol dehydrogenase [Aureimonas endophytica]
MFRALVVTKTGNDTQTALRELNEDSLPDGDVDVDVLYSTLNYKDALAITGRGPVVKSYPMVPGIDMAGRVSASRHPDFRPGDEVVLNGWGVGESHWGALAEKARLKGDWLIRRPAAFTPRQTMAIGTAGYTAMLAVTALERHGLEPGDGPVLVTGATGGVGSVAVMVLAKLGHSVAAVTGRPEHGDYLRHLGAAEILDRAEFAGPAKPLARERWAGAIDNVGSHTLANVCAGLRRGAAVAACGLAGGMDFPATVAPFILRGVALLGIDSVYRPRAEREAAWSRLGELLDPALLEEATSEIGLGEAVEAASALLDGRTRGRIVVDAHR